MKKILVLGDDNSDFWYHLCFRSKNLTEFRKNWRFTINSYVHETFEKILTATDPHMYETYQKYFKNSEKSYLFLSKHVGNPQFRVTMKKSENCDLLE